MNEVHLVLAAGYRMLANNKTTEIGIQDISIILNEKMSKENVFAIKALLKKYGAEKLVEVNPKDFKAFYEEAKRL